MMTVERPTDQAVGESPTQNAALGEWFADSDAPEEVQALRAWVAGLSSELAQARRERDEAQAGLTAATAEIAELRGRLAAAAVDSPAAPGAALQTQAPGDPLSPGPEGAASLAPTGHLPAASTREDAASPANEQAVARRVRLVAAAVLLLVVAAALAIIATPRLAP
jgi:hypothetical protein